MKLLIEVIKDSDAEHVYVRLPYHIVETGGPLHKDKPAAHFNAEGDLEGPYHPGMYLLLPIGMVNQGPRLEKGIQARELSYEKQKGGLSLWLVGKTLPKKKKLDPAKILVTVQGLTSWAEEAADGKWRDKLGTAEAAARTLGFDGIEVVEYPTYQEWETRLKSDIP